MKKPNKPMTNWSKSISDSNVGTFSPFRNELEHVRSGQLPTSINTAWRVFSGPYFPTFGLNTERYRMWKNTNQKKIRIWKLFTQCKVLFLLLSLFSSFNLKVSWQWVHPCPTKSCNLDLRQSFQAIHRDNGGDHQ